MKFRISEAMDPVESAKYDSVKKDTMSDLKKAGVKVKDIDVSRLAGATGNYRGGDDKSFSAVEVQLQGDLKLTDDFNKIFRQSGNYYENITVYTKNNTTWIRLFKFD